MTPGRGIAVVGMACRYADTRSPAELWENVLAERRAFRRLPAERLRLEDYWSADRDAADGIYSQEAAVLTDWELDRVRFRVAGSTYRAADPAHWLALDIAAQALAEAGYPDGEGLPREATGVLLGNSLTGEISRANLLRLRWPYVRRVVEASLADLAEQGWDAAERAGFLARLEESYKQPFPAMTEESLAGGLSNTIAGRICNHFDLKGGGYTVDGACASSLLAVAQACSALAADDLDLALAGGVDLSLDPFELVGFARTGALAGGADPEMRVFDRRSAGFIPGEGCGFVVLMREDDARAQGRRVHATIRGWGISSDGHGGISRPEAAGQLLAIERAYRRAGFGIETVPYFEGHGTGTAVGDATELAALGLALRRSGGVSGVPEPAPAVGSVKANLGHTKAAAGLAGLLKAILAVGHQVLPPNTGCDEPHPAVEQAGLRTLGQPEVWPADLPLRAGVSAMGFGGINGHLVIEGTATHRRRTLGSAERRLAASAQDAELFLLAAPDAAALGRQVERLQVVAPRLSRAELGDLAARLARDLPGGRVRAAVVAASPAELADRLTKLRLWLEEDREGEATRLDPRLGLFLGRTGHSPRIGFLFPGQGSPAHLGGGLWRRRFESVEELYARAGLPATGDGIDTAVAQPAIVTHSLAGLAVLDLLGLEAVVGVGHSLGEMTALCWAGACGEESLVRLATGRGRAMAELGSPTGAMAAIAAGPEVVAGLLTPGVGLAAFNTPASTVVSGEAEEVAAIVTRARARGLSATRLKVSHAFHSPLVAAATECLATTMASESFGPLTRRVASTVTGALLAPEADLCALILAQVTQPVRFTAALEAAGPGIDLWIEVGPGRVLTDVLDDFVTTKAIALDAGGPSLQGLLAAAGAAYCLGAPIDPAALFAGRFTRPFDLDAPPRFLVNPCELAPLPETAVLPLPLPHRDPAPALEETAAAPAATPSQSSPLNPLDTLRQLVASRAELPVAAVGEDSRLLSDLHFSSIAVGQLVAEAARQLGLPPPTSPSDYAQATVGEVARALSEQAANGAGPAEEDGLPAGVDGWVRAFTVAWVERPLPAISAISAISATAKPAGAFRVIALPGHPLAAGLAAALAGAGPGIAVCLPAEPDAAEEERGNAVDLLLAAAREILASPGPMPLLVVQQGGGGGGFARTLHLELPQVATRVVDLPFDHPQAAVWAAAEAADVSQGYGEAAYDAAGTRRVRLLRLLPEAPPTEMPGPPLGPDDVLLVTGGGKGIVAECALALARSTGVRLALLGRSLPSADPELAANLDRFQAAGVAWAYLPADVADPLAVEAAVAAAVSALGPVTGVLHGAGVNTPRLLGALDAAAVHATLAPKLAGAENLLAAVDPGRLKLFVAFGSILAETGLPGEADYALANEWLARWTERLARRHPACRCLALEWSVWAGAGMGERLGRLAALRRQGITPIPLDAGIAMFLALLARPIPPISAMSAMPPVSLVVAGRFGEPPTLAVERPELPLLRFLERPRVYYPGVELVADTELGSGTDPYLEDHVFRGDRLLPAVLGLEAMAQVAQAALGPLGIHSGPPPVFEAAEFPHPVVVPEKGSAVVRVAALVRGPGRVEAVLRTAATGFAVDHFRVTCRFGEAESEAPAAKSAALPGDEARAAVVLEPAADLYGPVLFHTGRFRRVRAYRHLSATACLAEISPDGSTAWFGRYLPADLVLGDPGARDAAIHGIQACIPHATLLPVGVERIESGRIGTSEPYLLAARERERNGDTFVYDLEVRDASGRSIERWQGLTLRAVDAIPAPATWTLALLGPFLERRLQELLPESALRIAVERRKGEARQSASDAVLGRLLASLGASPIVRRRPDGKPEADPAARRQISVSHAGDVVLAVTGSDSRGVVGCDLEPVTPRETAVWRDLLGDERFGLAERLAKESGEGEDSAATRIWTAAECLTKAGALSGAPLVLDSQTADGWQLLRSGRLRIPTLVAPVRELGGPVGLAVLVES